MASNKDFLALVICNVLGYAIGSFLPAGPWSVYTSMLVSYHLFLVWLVVTAEHETGFSLPLIPTLVTHLSCLVVIVSLPTIRHYIPFFFLLRFGITYIAKFETVWLFSAATSRSGNEADPAIRISGEVATGRVRTTRISAPSPDLDPYVIPNDHEAWTYYLANRKTSDLKRGVSIKDEYAQWMRNREEARANARLAAGEASSVGDSSPTNPQTV
jgi:hypothetical protein